MNPTTIVIALILTAWVPLVAVSHRKDNSLLFVGFLYGVCAHVIALIVWATS